MLSDKTELTPKIAANALLICIASFFVLFILWASLSELDEVTRASGRIVPSKQIQIIQNLEGGIVKEILVRQGDKVKAGDVLVKLDRTQFDAEFNRNEEEFLSLEATIARLKAESNFEEPVFDEKLMAEQEYMVSRELNLFNARKAEFDASINSIAARLKQIEQELIETEVSLVSARSASALADREVELLKPLVERGIEPQMELVRAEQRKIEASGDSRIAELGIEKAKKSVEEVNLQIEAERQKFRASALMELNEAETNRNQLVDSLPALSDRVNRTDVLAPTDGIINQVMVSTLGGIVDSGMPIVELVPLDDTLLVEAEVQPQDIAFLRPGQDARVKLTAYDFARYGALEGRVENISADAILNDQEQYVYVIQVRTEENSLPSDDGNLPILPGMVAEVDILNGKKSIMRYLMNPVLKLQEKAFRER
ncbi:HlyD family type I secretion periplasmic adaptor subunit [Emcibacteraceae bacterium]|jgi:membrane fusion protein, adhesin transport system|nr:HlyD family type I secretion periplasmic adaptor subunit [Kordiimonadaceae bacterium]MDA9553668.1 HlyD family type I secretion periplasmic adaptor subunit [Emcibacteraceae bacterium]MDA9771725.1 HlyD family type I secretion periplasmic adaptor subunit [Emcibacteraceae bacterium]MDC1090361.1 HlyD family type I secretion periplasmic adaptor subunit [Emcibacteraceae bacterium]MDC1090377.1 HlyD family type I secretion periplasmic adaptor subunit [Emcibacteraceae bacterium]